MFVLENGARNEGRSGNIWRGDEALIPVLLRIVLVLVVVELVCPFGAAGHDAMMPTV